MGRDDDPGGPTTGLALEPSGAGAWWLVLALAAALVAVALAGLTWGVDLIVAPAPEVPGEVIEVLERAGARGVFAYDAASGLASLSAADLPEAPYLLSTTARALDARPDTLINVGSREDCVALARELADLRDAIGFCRPMP